MAVGLYPDATFGAMVAPVVGMMSWRVLELVVGVEEGVVALLPLYDSSSRKKRLSSMAAVSAESDAWTIFSWKLMQ